MLMPCPMPIAFPLAWPIEPNGFDCVIALLLVRMLPNMTEPPPMELAPEPPNPGKLNWQTAAPILRQIIKPTKNMASRI